MNDESADLLVSHASYVRLLDASQAMYAVLIDMHRLGRSVGSGVIDKAIEDYERVRYPRPRIGVE